MKIETLKNKLAANGYRLTSADLALLELNSIKNFIENMTEGDLDTFAWDVADKDDLLEHLRSYGFLIAPIEADEVKIQGEQIIVNNDIIDLEADTIFVLDKGYICEAYETEFDCVIDDYLYFTVIDEDDVDSEDENETFANIEIELYREQGQDYVYLANDGSSGCKYKYDSKEELKKYINDYIDDLFV